MPDPYFDAPREQPSEKGSYIKVDELPALDNIVAGLTLRPLVAKGMLASFVRYEPHSEAPLHAHEEEQIFVMLEGELEMELDGEIRAMRSGDVALIPAWVPHRVTAGAAPAYQLDLFCPPRRAMLDALAARTHQGRAL